MKAVILCGGKGTRISEETRNIPKPMVKIGKYPIILHIIKYYYIYNFRIGVSFVLNPDFGNGWIIT